MYTKANVKEYLEKDHPKLWATSKFNEICKIDYVNNNLTESFIAWIRKVKELHVVDMLDKIRQMIMAKFKLRQKIVAEKFVGHKIIPNVMKSLHAKTRSLKMTLTKRKKRPSNVQDWGIEHVQGATQAPQSIVVHEPQLEPSNIAPLAR
jgi:hypothetical protein